MYKFILFLFCTHTLFAVSNHAITYELSGRFGDGLVCYLHAKWLAYQYQIPLLYQPFYLSSSLVMHSNELPIGDDLMQNERINVRLGGNASIDLQNNIPVLYACPYFPEAHNERGNEFHFEVDWKDPEFRLIARKMIAPNKEIKLIVPPTNTINIALHVREGGGFDSDKVRLYFPLKLPPLSFYAEGLSKISSYFPGKKIYCHVFTDAKDPKQIIKLLKSVVRRNPQIRVKCNKSISYKNTELEDFFSLFNFDILIRPQSNFSIVPSRLHDFAIVHSPTECSVNGNQITINKTETKINKELYLKLFRK